MQYLSKYVSVFIVSLLFTYDFALNNLFDVLNSDLLTSFNLSSSMLGFISSLYFYGAIVLLIPAGFIIDRSNVRLLLPSIMLGMAFCVFLTGIAKHLPLLIISRLLGGCFGAFGFIGCVKFAVYLFEKKKLATATGIITTMGMFGGFLAQSPFEVLVEKTAWRTALILLAFLGVLIGTVLYLLLRNMEIRRAINVVPMRFLPNLKLVFMNLQNLFAAAYTSLMNLPIYMLGAMWGIPFFVNAGHLSRLQASNILGMLFIGTIIGAPSVSILADKIGNKLFLMRMGSVLSLALFLFIVISYRSYYLSILNFLLLGVTTSTQVLSYPLVVNRNPKYLSATATSVVSIISLLGGAAIQPLFAYFLTWSSSSKVITGADYLEAMKILFVTLSLAFVISLFMKRDTV